MRKLLLAGLVLSVVGVGTATAFVIREFNSGFPSLAPGLYAGAIVFSGENARKVPFAIERGPGAQDLAVFVGLDEIPAQRAPAADQGSGSLPLILSGPHSRLRLIGRQGGTGIYEGSFLNPISNETGTWTLATTMSGALSQESEEDVRAWALLWKQLQEIDHTIDLSTQKIAEQQAKIEKLNRFIVDEDALRKKADSRLGVATDAVKDARTKTAQLRTQLDTANRDIDLSQRVSARGRLVTLSRESIDREARWIEASLDLLAPETSPSFDQALQRAYRIKAIKDEISAERRRITDIENGARYKGDAPETADEEEFYKNLQN